jgi:hypothetical protein
MGTSVGILKLNANRNEISIYGSGHGGTLTIFNIVPTNHSMAGYLLDQSGYYNFPDSISQRQSPQHSIANFALATC